MPPSAPILHLHRAVLADNSNSVLRGYDRTLLDVYPPGSSIEQLGIYFKPLDAEDSIESVLPGREVTDRNKRRLIIVALSFLPQQGTMVSSLSPMQSSASASDVSAVQQFPSHSCSHCLFSFFAYCCFLFGVVSCFCVSMCIGPGLSLSSGQQIQSSDATLEVLVAQVAQLQLQ